MLDPTTPPRTVWDRAGDAFRSVSLAQWALIALALYAAFATVQLYGAQVKLPLIGTIGPEGYKPKAERFELELKAVRKAAAEATAAALANKARIETENADKAKEIDNAIDQSRTAERDRAERFIAAGGVRPAPGVCPGPAAAPAGGDRARGAAPLPGAPELDEPGGLHGGPAATVSVPADDVRICTDNTVLLEQSRRFILDLEARTRAAQADTQR
jgi:hypothetical protein